MKSRARYKTLILVVDIMILAMGIGGVYRIAERASLPATYTSTRDGVLLGKIRRPLETELRAGDRIRSVGGEPVFIFKDVEAVLDHRATGDEVVLEIERNGIPLSVSSLLVPYYGLRFIIIQSIVGSLFLLLAVWVLIKRPADEAAHVLHWALVAVMVFIVAGWGSYIIRPLGLGHLVHVWYLASNAFLPVLFVHYTLIFPRRKWPRTTRLLLPLYGIAVIFFSWMVLTFVQSVFPFSISQFHGFITAFNGNRWFFMLCLVFGVVNLIHSYRVAIEESERRKLRWVFLGLWVAPFSFVLFWALPYLLINRPLLKEEFIILLSSIVPITFAISIIRYHLMDIDLIFNRSTVYAVVLGTLLVIYLSVMGGLGALVGTLTERSSSLVASSGAAIMVAVLFQPVRRRVQSLVDRAFFRVKYDYRKAQRRFVEEMRQYLDVRHLAQYIVTQTDQLLQLERIGFLSLRKSSRRFVLEAHKNCDLMEEQKIPVEAEKLKPRSHLPLALDQKLEPGIPFQSADAQVFRRWGLALTMPMLADGSQVQGVLILGQKKSEARFSVEDIDLLRSVASQAGLAMARIRLHQKLVLKCEEARRLEELNQLKSYFVSSVSHDLKTPLTSIRMFAEILRTQKKIGKRQRKEYLEIIEGESDRLTRLIENVLDFAKVERGVKEYYLSEVDLNELVRQVVKNLRYQLQINEFKVEVELTPHKAVVTADEDAVKGALINLFSNAMKYSPKEKYVRVATFFRDGFAGVQVQDRGSGIPPEHQKYIFDPFYRAGDEKSQRSSGAGVGLALVKHIVDAHNGIIEVESFPEKGSTFTLLFPGKGVK